MTNNTTPISLIAQGFTLSSFLSEFLSNLDLAPDQTLETFYTRFEKTIGSHYEKGKNCIFTPGVMLGLLYLMIVLPKEKMPLNNPKMSFSDNWGDLKIDKWNVSDNKELEILLRRLRNSISHGRIKFDSENIIFEDAPYKDDKAKNKTKGVVDFQASIYQGNIERFTSQLIKEFNFGK